MFSLKWLLNIKNHFKIFDIQFNNIVLKFNKITHIDRFKND